jgi:glycosyltransferase involved in cell wall biosynthesis
MLRVGLVMPHIFMHRQILPQVIFAPGKLALDLAYGLNEQNNDVTLFTPGPLDTTLRQVNADLSLFKAELAERGDSYMDLLKKHPFTFITLARQVQSELIACAYAMANNDELDIVHIYGNEEETALPFAKLCRKPIVFTHHDPYNFLVKYRSVFPKYVGLNWVSMSMAQRKTMPLGTNWVGNIYHGLDPGSWRPNYKSGTYLAYLGRIIEPKGLRLAIKAVKIYNAKYPRTPLTLKIAGKHYAGDSKDSYWQKMILPELNNEHIEYVGFIRDHDKKQAFLGDASALIVPSTFSEPFGMVMIEALACGTPLIGLDSGAIPEVIRQGKNGFVVKKSLSNEDEIAKAIADSFANIDLINRRTCREDFEARFSLNRMVKEHAELYAGLVTK